MGKIWLFCAIFLSFIVKISAMLAIPTEDLLGPEICPTGSFCIDTSQCTTAHYVTKSGNPFYCGPRHYIDSKICCVETEAPSNFDALHNDHDDMSESSDLDPSSLNKRTIENDDEIDIISLPFADNQAEDDLPNFNLFDSDTVSNKQMDDMESTLEDALEQELNSGQPLSSQSNVRETGFGDGDEIINDFGRMLDNHLNNGQESNPNIHFKQEPFQGVSQPEGTRPIVDTAESHQNPNMEFRMRYDHEDANRNRAFACPCEKGEKGDPGPKGEPGEPGKIIYVPVFVNTVSPGSPTTPGTGNTMFSSPQQMNQHVPQHPNPTVMPYHVPVGIQSPPLTQHQQYKHPLPPSLTTNQVPQPPTAPTLANSIPYADSLDARLTRNAYGLKQNDQRFVNRRY